MPQNLEITLSRQFKKWRFVFKAGIDVSELGLFRNKPKSIVKAASRVLEVEGNSLHPNIIPSRIQTDRVREALDRHYLLKKIPYRLEVEEK